MRFNRLISVAFGLALVATPLQADVVSDWNDLLLDSIRAARTNPPAGSRQMAILNVSIYDSVNGIAGTHKQYHVADTAPAGASAEAAAIAAAHTVLVSLYPANVGAFDAAREDQLAAIPDGPSKSSGISWGEDVAGQILDLRADDGSTAIVSYPLAPGTGWWQPTPPAFASPLLPGWGKVKPWTLFKRTQFRVAAPPPVTSREYAISFDEVLRLGSTNSTERTADQTEIALFWNDGAGTQTPPGHWIEIATALAAERGLGLAESARLLALVSLTVADAAEVSWDIKFHYGHWRPFTGILDAEDDGNPATHTEAGWSSFITTPPFPAYTSGHSTFSGSSSRLLALFFGTDDVPFSIGSDGLPGVTRSFDTLSEAAEEAGQSRIYGGIHWQYDNTAGLESGRALAEHVFFNFLRPVIQPGTCAANATTLCLSGGRFKVETHWAKEDGSHGAGFAVGDGSDSGRFWFFNADNTEVTTKVLDGCAGNERYWVFASGLTDVEVTLTVTDTHTGAQRSYFNPLGKAFAPVLDANAFATCP